jgi:HAD superfamily hydrolase (TIGR01549 family)
MTFNKQKIKAICFDIDGTLSDTDNQMVARVQRWLAPLRILVDQEALPIIARRIVMALESPINIMYEWLDRFNLEKVLTWAMDRFEGRGFRKHNQFLLIEGVIPMLDSLSKKYPLAIISARDEKSAMHFLQQFKLFKYFKVIITSQTCPHTKPFAQPLLFAAERLGVPPKDILMVGDTYVDIKMGKRAGAQTLGVLCGFGTEKELEKEGADKILASTADLKELLG